MSAFLDLCGDNARRTTEKSACARAREALRIERLYVAGNAPSEIARRIGASVERIRQVLRRRGWRVRSYRIGGD